MSLPRVYVQTELRQGQELNLPKDVSHHFLNVLRLKPSDDVIVYNGQGGEFHAEVLETSKKSVTVFLTDYKDISRTTSINLYCGLCVMKRNAMDRAITRCVELGISTLTPLISEHCAVKHKVIRDRHSHWQQIIISASEQCGLNILPLLEPAIPILTWFKIIKADLKLIASPGGGRLPSASSITSVASVTGPEGGFSTKELLQASEAKFNSVKFGDRILTGENAPVVVLSAIHQNWGDFSY